MCTVSWLQTASGYELFFNRDEQRSRPRAQLPAYDTSTDAIWPRDPVGGGTWIALTRQGVSFCLLNHYQAEGNRPAPITVHSRGLLIPRLLNIGDIPLATALAKMDLQPYRPFTCCRFAPGDPPEAVVWDGEHHYFESPQSPLISSGVDLAGVTRIRRELASRQPNPRQSLLGFHRSHHPQPGAYSVCMHRDDACTHSLSHLQVSGGLNRFTYYDGAPCSTPPRTTILPRR